MRPVYKIVDKKDSIEYYDFIAVGDTGTGDVNQMLVAESMKSYHSNDNIESVLMLGDNFYPLGVFSVKDSKWQTHFVDIYDENLSDIIFYPVLGNHDYFGIQKSQIQKTKDLTQWNMKNYYYTFKKMIGETTIQFIALDTILMLRKGKKSEKQLLWLKNILKASDAEWKIVYGHHPVFSNGYHGDTPYLIKVLEPILSQNNVDLYLSGHDHDLQILKPYKDVLYIVSGSGAKVRPSGVGENTIYCAGLNGFAAFSISEKEMIINIIIKKGLVDFSYVIEKN